MTFIMAEKTIFLIDGAYLSFISKFLGKGKHLKFKIENFAKNIAKKLKKECNEIYFYTAPPYQSQKPTEEENKRKANYDKFIEKLKKIANPKILVREGRCQKIKNDFSQKGVDTLMTIDLLKTSLNENIKTILILTSDTNFVPVINEIKEKKELVLAYFTDKKRKSAFTLSNHLWNAFKKKIHIKLNDFYNNN